MLTPRNNAVIDTGDTYNLLCYHNSNIGYKSKNSDDISKFESNDSRIWMTGMSDMALHLYFKNITTVKPISELQP